MLVAVHKYLCFRIRCKLHPAALSETALFAEASTYYPICMATKPSQQAFLDACNQDRLMATGMSLWRFKASFESLTCIAHYSCCLLMPAARPIGECPLLCSQKNVSLVLASFD